MAARSRPPVQPVRTWAGRARGGSAGRRWAAARVALLAGGAALTALSVLVVLLVEGGQVRTSADSLVTTALWTLWLPVALALAAARLSPPRLVPVDPLAGVPDERVAREAAWLTGCAVAFAAALGALLLATGDVGAGFVVAKAVLLVALPLVVLRAPRRIGSTGGGWRLLGPVLPVAVWVAVAWAGPLAADYEGDDLGLTTAEALVLLLGAFLVNAVLEEVFYRMWLQTRLERLVGRWAAIVATALLWASWHLALRWTGDLVTDLASTVAALVPSGLLLGYLWSRYRNPVAVILVHGLINAPLGFLVAVL